MNQKEILTAWKAARAAGTVIPAHAHDCYELVYYLRGKGKTSIGPKACLFATDSLAVIPPGVEHSEQHDKQGAVLCVEFQSDTPLPTGVYSDRDGSIYPVAVNILTELREQRSGYTDVLYAKAWELAALIRRVSEQKSVRQINRDFRYAITYLKENFHEKIVFEELAQELHYGYDYFHHRFKELTGCSPRKYLLNLRLNRAKELLQDATLNCTDISYRCGFSNSSQFSALFKASTGVTPSEYRKRRLH